MTDKMITDPDWHGWHLDTSIPALVYSGDSRRDYWIDLDRMLTRDQFGWWVLQTYGKGWGSYALEGFATAVDEILDMQAIAEFTPESIRRQVAKFRSGLN